MAAFVAVIVLFLVLDIVLAAAHFAEETRYHAAREGHTLPNVDTIIVGAGGAGVQAALLLKQRGMSYVVLDKAQVVGSFWTTYPVFGELISINKWVRNETQAMRYDWHSLLGASLRMRDVTDEYFPSREHLQTYLARVASEERLDVRLGVEVIRIHPRRPCVVLAGEVLYCARRRVLVATGLAPRPEPVLEAMGGIPYGRFKREQAVHRRVCILGNGNSGFEVAQNTFGVAERVTIYGKRPFRLSAVTRYTGDVRSKFLQVVENLNGKLLDTAFHFPPISPNVTVRGMSLSTAQRDELAWHMRTATWLRFYECETFVIATGFRSHVPGVCLSGAFPATGPWWTDTDNASVHYIGWLMHEGDFRAGAGGFLSGYRYLIRRLVDHFEERDESRLLTTAEAVRHVLHRVQVADDLLIMQDGVVLRDVLLPAGEGRWRYHEGVPYAMMPELRHDGAVHLYFAWGDGRRSMQVFDSVFRYTDTRRLINMMLHPVLEVAGELTRHVLEDLEQAWRHVPYERAVLQVAREALSGNTTRFAPRRRYPYVRGRFEESGKELDSVVIGDQNVNKKNPAVMQALLNAVVSQAAPRVLVQLSNAMREWMPVLMEEK